MENQVPHVTAVPTSWNSQLQAHSSAVQQLPVAGPFGIVQPMNYNVGFSQQMQQQASHGQSNTGSYNLQYPSYSSQEVHIVNQRVNEANYKRLKSNSQNMHPQGTYANSVVLRNQTESQFGHPPYGLYPPHVTNSNFEMQTRGMTPYQQPDMKILVPTKNHSSVPHSFQAMQNCDPADNRKSVLQRQACLQHPSSAPRDQFQPVPTNIVMPTHFNNQSEMQQMYAQEMRLRHEHEIQQKNLQQAIFKRNAEQIRSYGEEKDLLETNIVASPRLETPNERCDTETNEINFSRLGDSPLIKSNTAKQPEDVQKLKPTEFWQLLSVKELEEESLPDISNLTFEENWLHVLKRASTLLIKLPFILSFGAHELVTKEATSGNIPLEQFEILNETEAFSESVRVLYDRHYSKSSDS